MKSNYLLKKIIQYSMRKSQRKLKKNTRYFYPLAIPTYSSSEVIQSIDSMVNFKTSMHEKVRKFENLFAEKYGGEAIMVNSGSSADLLISFALRERIKVSRNSEFEVLIPAVTWPTHVWSPLMAGFKVRLVDVDPATLNFSIEDIERKISDKTKVIFIVHLLGNTGDMQSLVKICKEKNIILLEDCCEALGSKFNNQYVGSFGLASSFSFFFSHHMVTMEGGMILTRDKTFAQTCRLLRSHGWSRELRDPNTEFLITHEEKYKFLSWGFNVRPTELQGGFGLEQIRKIDKFQDFRNKHSNYLRESIEPFKHLITTMHVSENVACSWFAFPFLVNKSAPFTKNQIVDYLEQCGIETRPIVAGNLSRQPALINSDEVISENLVGADYVNDFGFYIGIHPNSSMSDLARVVTILKNYLIRWSAYAN